MPSPPPKLVEKVSTSLTIPGTAAGENIEVQTGVVGLQNGDVAVANFPNGLPAGLFFTPAMVTAGPFLVIRFANLSGAAIGTQNFAMQVLIAR